MLLPVTVKAKGIVLGEPLPPPPPPPTAVALELVALGAAEDRPLLLLLVAAVWFALPPTAVRGVGLNGCAFASKWEYNESPPIDCCCCCGCCCCCWSSSCEIEE